MQSGNALQTLIPIKIAGTTDNNYRGNKTDSSYPDGMIEEELRHPTREVQEPMAANFPVTPSERPHEDELEADVTFDDVGGDELMDGMRTAAGEATKLLRSIGSPHRLMILCLLMDGEKTVTEISEAIGTRQSLTSQHLTHLRLHGLVQVERRGHFAYYSLKHVAAREIVGTLYRHYCAAGIAEGPSSC